MKKLLLFTGLLFLGPIIFAQSVGDSIKVENSFFGGYLYTQGGELLSFYELDDLVKSNPLAYKQMRKAQSEYTVATVVSFAGGLLIGYPLGTALGGGEPNWSIAGVGVVLTIIAIPIESSAHRKANQAIDLYNQGLNSSSARVKKELKLALNGNGFGLVFRF